MCQIKECRIDADPIGLAHAKPNQHWPKMVRMCRTVWLINPQNWSLPLREPSRALPGSLALSTLQSLLQCVLLAIGLPSWLHSCSISLRVLWRPHCQINLSVSSLKPVKSLKLLEASPRSYLPPTSLHYCCSWSPWSRESPFSLPPQSLSFFLPSPPPPPSSPTVPSRGSSTPWHNTILLWFIEPFWTN